jgi:hypothetical protein
MMTTWQVVATHRLTGKRFYSWHSNRDEAINAAKEQRSRRVWKSVKVEKDNAAIHQAQG